MVPLIVIILSVLLGNIMYVAGLATINPIAWSAGISHSICRVACGRPMIDPNVGFITQPLGHLSAVDLLHGHLPWWNYFEGLGQPLAGEMQAASLFPLTLLFLLPSGLLWFHVAFEIISGLTTYFLAKRLGISPVFATTAGILFALNGTFAWLGNSALNPIAFLPMLLLGVEIIYDADSAIARRGWYVVAVALALSIYAGFPETAYLDGLMVAGWAVVRLFSVATPLRLLALGRLALGAVLGVVVSLPILVPFLDFMKVANVGGHVGAVDGVAMLPTQAGPMLLDPYVYGTILSNPNAVSAWGSTGGYLLASVTACALLGLFGNRLRGLRLFLGAWIVIGLSGAFNILHSRPLWNVLPLLKTIALSRYIFPSCELALIVLAALGIMDFAHSARAKRLFTVTALVALGLTLWSALAARSTNQGVHLSTTARVIFVGLDALPFIALGLLLILGRFTRARATPILIALVLVGEALLVFFVPTAEAAKQITIDAAPITFLQTHEGQERFLDFGVLNPNWGTQFNLNSLSAIDLPFPHRFTKLIATQLFPAESPSNQFTIHGGMAGIIAQQNAVAQHFGAFEKASVKYLLISNKVRLIPALTHLGVRRVFKDSLASIYQMPAPRSFYSTSANSCAVQSSSVNVANVTCATTGTTLVRTELTMRGWHAFVNGREVPIHASDEAYQSVSVPAGKSTVTFNFSPPHEKYALLVGLLGILFMAGVWWRDGRSKKPGRRPRHRRTQPLGSNPTPL